MERFRISLPQDDQINSKGIAILHDILPISIKKVNDIQYNILFLATTANNDEKYYFQLALASSNENDTKFLDSHPMNISNIVNNPNRSTFYKDAISGMGPDTLYATDLNMLVDEDKPIYFRALAYNTDRETGKANILALEITRDNYIKLSLFFSKFMRYDITAETVFMNHKLHNIGFVKIMQIKLDGSATDFSSKIVCNHYTAWSGPTSFKFNFISPKFKDKKLRNPMSPVTYNDFYREDFVITDMVYDANQDYLYIIYEERSSITDSYKCTKALILDKSVYDHTNLLELDKIYE